MSIESEKKKTIKEKLLDLPILGWFFGVVFRVLGIRNR
jgi:hypothetical protein